MNRIAGLLSAALVAAAVMVLPAPMGLPPEGQRMGALFLSLLILWVTEAIPVAVTALLAVALLPIFRIMELQPAFTAFISPVFFFVLAMYSIAHSFAVTGLDRRFALWLLHLAGTDSRRVAIALITGTGLLSTIISDVPCCAMFMAIALSVIERLKLTRGESSFAKCLMMGVPIAALIGGVGTPAGSSINLIGLYFIEQHGKVSVPFLHWMAIGMPMVIVLLPCAAWILLHCYPPEVAAIGRTEDIERERGALGPIGGSEWRALCIMSGMVTLWIASTWVKQIDIVLVAMVGASLMYLPGIDLLRWPDVQRATGWDGLLLIGAVTALGAASAKSGLAKWLVDAALGGVREWNAVWTILIISAFAVVIHLLLPIGPVINAVLIPPIAMLAADAGQNPALYGLPVAFTASCAFLLPLDAVPLITYGKGYYRMLDMLLPGALISVCWVLLITLLLTIARPLLWP